MLRYLLTAAFILTASPALADCYTLKGDDQTVCMARTRGDVGMCYAVRDLDRQSACLAEFRQDRYLCASIRDAGERSRCEMEARR